MVDHRRTVDPGVGRESEAERSIAELGLGRWPEVRHRVLARLVPSHRAGPLSFEPLLARRSGPVPARFDVGIDVAGGIVHLDRDLVNSLAVPPAVIWRAAVTNLEDRVHPAVLAVPGDPVAFTVMAGGPWTTGLLLVPGHLDSVAASAGTLDASPSRTRRRSEPEPTTVVVAPRPEILVIGRGGGDTGEGRRDGQDRGSQARSTVALAATLAEADGGPRLPLVPLRPMRSIQEVLSRAHGFWNDVPVSEQPGLR